MQHSKTLMHIGWLFTIILVLVFPFSSQAADAKKPAAAASLLKTPRTSKQMYILGSTLMREYVGAIADRLTKKANLPQPIIDNKGSTRGIEAFCAGTGLGYPDIVAVSRQIRSAELDTCKANGVKDVIAIKIGYEANVLVSRHDDQDYHLDLDMFYRAIANELPRDVNDFIPNTQTHWNEIDPSLPHTEIRFLISAKGLGGRGFLEDRMLEAACRNILEIKTIFGADDRVKQCTTMRSDGRITELDIPYGENVVKAMATAPLGTIAVMPLHFAEVNPQVLKVQTLGGVMPNAETVSTKKYDLIRPLYFLVKKAHVKDYWGNGLVFGLREFITEVTRESTIGPNGYLTDLGLIPIEAQRRSEIRDASLRLDTINR